MLRWIRGNTRKDEIQNEKICLKIEIVPIDEKIELFEMILPCIEESD
jgi:hypothetical protein